LKTSVATITADIKILADYDIVDTDLDVLILRATNLVLKRMKQWFMDDGLFDEITATDTLTTVAAQEFIDIATETADLDQPYFFTERTNDSPITLVSFSEYRARFPNPASNSTATPDIVAFFANRLYIGPTPSGAISIFFDYFKLTTKLTSSDSMPYEDKYDEVIINGVLWFLVKWLDRKDINMIREAKADFQEARHDLITGASKNIGMVQASQSRVPDLPFFSPRKVI